MRYYYYIFVTFLYHFIDVISSSNDLTNNHTVFVPTRDWQIVNKGTPIPKGLHVRHNFQTGITEAKLMDNHEHETENSPDYPTDYETQKSLTVHPNANELLNINESDSPRGEFPQNEDSKANLSATELRARLKTIKSMSKKAATLSSKAEDKEEFGNIHESEIKFGESMAFDDFDHLKIFIQRFDTYRDAIAADSLSLEEIKIVIDILSQLEYLVHDIDNGLEFAKAGGLVKVINPCLNVAVDDRIKLEALRVLGASVQSNLKVKKSVLESDLLQRILKTLKNSSDTKLSDRCLYALSSLVRNYPAAQKVLLDNDGLEVFSKILAEGQISTQKRVMNLINDLIVENRESKDEINDANYDRDKKIPKYTDVELEDKITNDVKLCKNIGNLLIKTTQREIGKDDVEADKDFLETVYQCALTTGNICKNEFNEKRNEILPAIDNITLFFSDLHKFKQINNQENDYEHIMVIVQKLKDIIVEKSFKDEL